MEGDIRLGNSINTLNWDFETENFNLDLNIPDLNYGTSLTLELSNFIYNTNFQVGWIVGYDTGWAISWLFGEGGECNLASWPNMNLNLTRLEGTINLKTWDAGEDAWITSDSDGDDAEPDVNGRDQAVINGFPLIILILFSFISVIIIIHKTRNYP